jgi:hypothetical protein
MAEKVTVSQLKEAGKQFGRVLLGVLAIVYLLQGGRPKTSG